MKNKELKKLPNSFTRVKSVLALGLSLNLTQLVLAQSLHSENPGNGKYSSNKKRSKVDSSVTASQDNLNFNKIDVQSKIKMSDELKKQFFVGFNLNDLLNTYSFTNDKHLMSSLYSKASNGKGDYTSLLSDQNPFSKFMDYEIESEMIDKSKKWKDFSVNGYNLKKVLDRSESFALNRKTFYDLPFGLRINSTLQINPQLNPNGCQVCSPADYKPIAKEGISLDVTCIIGGVSGDGSILYKYNDKNPLRYTTGVKAYITSQTEKVDIETPVINSSVMEEIRVNYCHDQNIRKIQVHISCGLLPSTNWDKVKLLASFNESSIGIKSFIFNLKNFNELKHNEFMAKEIKLKRLLSGVRGGEIVGGFPFLGIDRHYETVAYKFPKFTDDIIIYANSESELADVVRRFYISGYELLKTQNQGN